MLTSPLRDRFGVINRLEFYNSAELKEIAIRSSRLLGTELHDDAAGEIAARSRGTPRIANRILKRIRDFAQVRGNGVIDMNITREALDALDVDSLGLDDVDRQLLNIIIDKFGGGPAGVEAIAATLREDRDTIEDVYEPFLLQEGLIERTARGRLATRRAYEHLGKTAPKGLF
jgi:Holliday junction DNA helicase RuvB